MMLMAEPGQGRLLLLVNGEDKPTEFELPEGGWQLVFCSADVGGQALERQLWLPAYSIALVEEPA